MKKIIFLPKKEKETPAKKVCPVVQILTVKVCKYIRIVQIIKN